MGAAHHTNGLTSTPPGGGVAQPAARQAAVEGEGVADARRAGFVSAAAAAPFEAARPAV